MVQLPPILVRMVATVLTQALTRKLAQSPLFFRIVDRMIHEIDHMPHRVQGRQVPTYQPPIGMREKEWDTDHGEPHDLPSPFPSNARKATNTDGSQTRIPPPKSFQEAQRQRARESFQQAQRRTSEQRAQQAKDKSSTNSDAVSNELRDLQNKLRELRGDKTP